MSDRVIFAVGDDAVGEVTLNRPEKLNALDMATFEGLRDAAGQARDAIDAGRVRAVLVRAAGRAFCSGLDVSLFATQVGQEPDPDWIARLQDAFTGLEDLAVPVVAAVQGAALGGGCQLALAAHLRLAAPDMTMGLLETRWAIIPDLGGLTRLPRLIGLGRATDMAMTARVIDAHTALDWGLVDQVVDAADFDGAARAYAAKLAAGPTVAMGRIPALLRRSFTAERDAMLRAERESQVPCLSSEDFAEAATAASQGREPHFRGR